MDIELHIHSYLSAADGDTKNVDDSNKNKRVYKTLTPSIRSSRAPSLHFSAAYSKIINFIITAWFAIPWNKPSRKWTNFHDKMLNFFFFTIQSYRRADKILLYCNSFCTISLQNWKLCYKTDNYPFFRHTSTLNQSSQLTRKLFSIDTKWNSIF